MVSTLKIVHLRNDASAGEIRRLSVQVTNVSSLVALVDAASGVCPHIRDSKNSICWKDDEGDYITIASDPELTEAVAHASDGLFTIYIKDKSMKRADPREAFVPKANFRKWLRRFLKRWHAKHHDQASKDQTSEEKEEEGDDDGNDGSDVEEATDPKIDNALEEMIKMGFTNEGEWLAKLLEAKEGDIDKAIETIRQNKKIAKSKHGNVRDSKKE